MFMNAPQGLSLFQGQPGQMPSNMARSSLINSLVGAPFGANIGQQQPPINRPAPMQPQAAPNLYAPPGIK